MSDRSFRPVSVTCVLFAADAIAVPVEVAGVTRIAASYRRRACRSRGIAILEVYLTAPSLLRGGRRRIRTAMAVAPAILAIVVAAIGSQAPGVGACRCSVDEAIDKEQDGECKERTQREPEPDFPFGLMAVATPPFVHEHL